MILSRIDVESNKCSLNYFNIQDSLFQDWHSIDPFAKCQLARVLIDFDAYVLSPTDSILTTLQI